jgi:hypothetical protein
MIVRPRSRGAISTAHRRPLRLLDQKREMPAALSRNPPRDDLSRGGALGRHSGGGIRTRDLRVMSPFRGCCEVSLSPGIWLYC